MKRNVLPAERARIQAGYSLNEAARKLNLSPAYLRQIERNGQAPLKTARRLARLYHCSGNVFLYSPTYLEQLGQGTATGPSYASTPGTDAGNAAAGADTSATNVSTRASRRYRPPKTPVLTISHTKEGEVQ